MSGPVVTQADRDAVTELFRKKLSAMLTDAPVNWTEELSVLLAAAREQERADVVAWLRGSHESKAERLASAIEDLCHIGAAKKAETT